MDKYEKKILEIELAKGTLCALHHGSVKGFSDAVDYIHQNIGQDGKGMYKIVIPVCAQCLEYLQSTSFVLLYCLKCSHNRWVYTPTSKLDFYGKHICWMSCCPVCKEQDEKVNIFFAD